MRNLIIITGDLAAGKSTLANSLSIELQIPCLVKDTLKEIACDAIGYETREEAAIALSQSRSIGETGFFVLYDNNNNKVVGEVSPCGFPKPQNMWMTESFSEDIGRDRLSRNAYSLSILADH